MYPTNITYSFLGLRPFRKFITVLALLLLGMGNVWGQTYYNMSSGNYSQNFVDMANWTNNFTAGTGASNWKSVVIIGSGTSVTTGTRTTKSSATFVTGTSGGLQKGTQAMVFLSTGSTATPEAVAVDLLLDFSGRTAGTISFDWAAIDNSSGTRPTSLRVFYSTDGTAFTEITAAQVLDQVSSSSGTISAVSLPAALNNASTVTIRFYNHAGSTSTGSGSRDKFQIDNISVTSTAAATAPALTSPTVSSITTTSATLGATVSSNGGAALSARGTVWGTSASPTGNASAEGGTTVAAFSHSRTGLTANTLYTYRGYATNSVGTGYSADGTFTTLPLAPTVGSGNSITASGFTANWSHPTMGSASYTYTVEVDDDNAFGSINSTVSSIASSNTSQAITGLSPSTTYYYRVKAVNAQGSSVWSSTSAGVTTSASASPLISCSPLTAFGSVCINTTAGPNSFVITGTSLTSANVTVSSITGYTFSTTSGGSYTSSLSLTQGGGSYSQTIYVKFTPTSASAFSGNIVVGGGGASNVNVAASGTGTSGTVAVTTTTASSITTATASTGGTSVSTTCGTITAKGVAYGTSANPTTPTTSNGTGTGNFTSSLSGLTPNTVYNYRAYATNSNAVTNYGTDLTFTTLHNAPNVGSGSGATQTAINANWTAPTGGGSATFTYEVAISTASDFSSTLSTQTGISSGTLTYQFTSLTGGTTYYFRVRANNAGGSSAWSAISVGYATLSDAISLTALGTAATEDFNTLANSGTSSTTPTGWFFSESGSNTNTTYAAGTGSDNGGNTYSFGPASNTERAFGTLLSGSLVSTIGAKLINSTGSTINNLFITYTGETWRVGEANRIDRLDFKYSLDATSLTTGTWTDFDGLDYENPGQSTGSGSMQHSSNISDVITGLSIANGSTFWIRWNDLNASGSDDGMAVDDFSIKPCGTVSPPTASAQSFCSTASATVASLVATGTAIQWYSASTGGTALATSTALTTGTYYASQTLGGCESVTRASSTITLSSNNTATAASLSPTLCINTSLTNITHSTTGATGIGTATGLPSGITAAWASNTITISGTPSASGTFSYSIPLTGGCGSVNATGSITVTALPTATAGGTQTICQTGTATVIGASSSNGTILWTENGAGYITAGATTLTPTYTAAAGDAGNTVSLTMTVSNSSCTAATATYSVVVNALPTITGTANVCMGSTTALTGSGTAASSNAWSSSNTGVGTINTTTTTGTLSPVAAGTTNVTYTDNNGCVSAATTITVNALPTVTATASQSICPGSSVTLSGGGASSYSWNNGITNGVAFTPSATTTYTVTGTDANGCTGTSQTTITVNAAPTLSINASANTLCSGTSATLTASGASTYAWNNGVSNGVAFTPNATQTYTVTGTAANGCTGTSQTTITVNAAPTLSINASNNTLCSGTSATLTASGASTYAWNNGVSNGVAFTPNATQTYTVTGTAANGCTGTAQTTISVNASPASNSGSSILGATTCGMNSVLLGGNALAAGQSGTWTLVSGTNANGVFTLPGSNATVFTGSYGGTYVLNWAVQNASTGCIGNDTMVVTFNQPIDVGLTGMIGTGDLLWCGLTNTDWSTASNWYQKQAAGHYVRMSSAVPSLGNEVFTMSTANAGICVGNNTPTLSINSNAEDVYVGPGITWNLSNDSINIAQNLVNNGTIIASTGITSFTGSSNSTISGAGNTQLFNMRVNKSVGATLTLQQPVLVTNTLAMNQGNVFTTSANLLTLGTSSAAPGSLTYNSGTIVGPFKRYFANTASAGTAGLFPVGTAVYNRYADLSFGSGPGVDQFLTVEYMTGAPLQGGVPLYNGLPLIASGSLIQNYSADGYWSVIPTNNNYAAPITSVNYGVTLFANNLTGMQSPQVCRIIKGAGSNNAGQHHVAWQACGTHTPINGAPNPQAFLITSTATQGFSWFNIGTPNSQALPVELLSFNGDCNEGQVNISWQTATEHNSDYFEVEKSRDGMNWQVLTTVNAAGKSTQLLNYEAMDAYAMEVNNYYRLTQVDIDGSKEIFNVINIRCDRRMNSYFTAYPNPSTGSFQVILNDKQLVGSGILSVKDTKGTELLNRTIEVKPGINMFSVTDLNLAPGVYYIQIVNGERATDVLKEVIR